MSWPMHERHHLGATYLGDGLCRFEVWAPFAQKVDVHILEPQERWVPLERGERGYHQALAGGVEPGTFYMYRLDEQKERPDPASRFQPRDVHGPSQVVEGGFSWDDGCWFGLPLDRHIFYELHVGTFTPEGTFDAVVPHLDHLLGLGISAVEIMPVAQFPGNRNWGYDGVYPYAVQSSYGGPWGLKRLVNSCHQRGLAVVLDVVYNHLGPEGNYLWDFGPYFTDRYRTPWGSAVNFDGPDSDEVRRFFIQNALYWVTEFHVDALRLDAVHAIFDQSAHTFLEELAEAVHGRAEALNRRVHVIAESDLNDSRLIRPRELGGYGLDAQWSDDLHHALHTLLTGENEGYYRDFGALDHLVRAFRHGYVYSGQHSEHRRRRHGNSTQGCSGRQFVVCSQNHDQVGNRMLGDRSSRLVPLDGLKLAAAAVILSPYLPLLFMGEEYGETTPFPYFISHLDSDLVEAVRRGRREEFSAFSWLGEPPDPQDEGTFLSAKLQHRLRTEGQHRTLLEFYRELIRLRREVPALASLNRQAVEVLGQARQRILLVRRTEGDCEAIVAFNLGESQALASLPVPAGRWRKSLDSADQRWLGEGSLIPHEIISEGEVALNLGPRSLVLLTQLVEA